MLYLGVDLGGTGIKAGIFDDSFAFLSRAGVATPKGSPEQIADAIAVAVDDCLSKAGLMRGQIAKAGLGSPGSVNPQEGIITFAGNLGFHNVPLGALLKERTGMDFHIDNDASAAARGEFTAGAGKGVGSMVLITIGTGIGCGIIIDRKVYRGYNHAGGEAGHMVIVHGGKVCTCGRKGCFERYASATALIGQIRTAMQDNRDSLLWQVCPDIESVNGETVFRAMELSDKTAAKVFERYIDYLACGIINITNILLPELVCIGGGISARGAALIEPLNARLQAEGFAYSHNHGRPTVRAAQLRNDAGIIGAPLNTGGTHERI